MIEGYNKNNKISEMESVAISRIIEEKNVLFFVVISIIAFFIRWTVIGFKSSDMMICLEPWYDEIKNNGGLLSLKNQVGNYNLLYQTLIAVMTYINVDSILQYKLLSIVFDYILAVGIAFLAMDSDNGLVIWKERKSLIAYSIVLILPEVIMNSSLWGQCDSIYSTFCIFTLLCMWHNKYLRAFIFYGFAVAFKLQAIFLMPFMIIVYFCKKKYSIFYFVLSLISFWSSGIVAYIYGRSLLAPFSIYLSQTGDYPFMYLNSLSFWRLIGDDYATLKNIAILLTVSILGLCMYSVIDEKIEVKTKEQFIRLACWTIWTCYLFLPGMHERYGYLLDVLLIPLLFIDKKKYLLIFIIVTLFTAIQYAAFLFSHNVVEDWQIIIYILCYVYMGYLMSKKENEQIEA
ncbi:MAG: hypothetical protein E7274_02445 [Pseudobutyrivibrio ruminis]|uniref:hypothetical protein n=1 Tax=Pseudobutyrivibrio ruminis TaxID=46206 RepID=UPI0026ED0B40|nr:hypothetical protein [Pseudobutyrivibrio ruminis]MBE5912902.1 hypothetical protein [Pseudobutyrivibrio ruminis]